jgi:hypothetical protein
LHAVSGSPEGLQMKVDLAVQSLFTSDRRV